MGRRGIPVIDHHASEIILERHRSIDPYLRLPSSTIKDPTISWKSLGMLAYMLDLPPDWKFRHSHLAALRKGIGHGNGRDAVSSVVKELQTAGYLQIEIQRKQGKFHQQVWHVADRPIFKSGNGQDLKPKPASPDPVNPNPEMQDAENPTLHTMCKKHYSPLVESETVNKARKIQSGVGVSGKHVFIVDPATNIHYEQGNLPDAQALALIKQFPAAQIRDAATRAQKQDDRGRAFPSATLRELKKYSGSLSHDAPAWATMESNPPNVVIVGECLEAEFTEDDE